MVSPVRRLLCLAALLLLVLAPSQRAAAREDGWTLRLIPRRILAQAREEPTIRNPSGL